MHQCFLFNSQFFFDEICDNVHFFPFRDNINLGIWSKVFLKVLSCGTQEQLCDCILEKCLGRYTSHIKNWWRQGDFVLSDQQGNKSLSWGIWRPITSNCKAATMWVRLCSTNTILRIGHFSLQTLLYEGSTFMPDVCLKCGKLVSLFPRNMGASVNKLYLRSSWPNTMWQI